MYEKNDFDRLEQIEAMRMGVDYRISVSVRDFTVHLRPLTSSETLDVAARVQEKIRNLPEFYKNNLTELTVLSRETLKVASTSDIGADDAKINDYILDRMTNDELLFLHKQYISVCDKVNPSLESLPAEELKKIVAHIKQPLLGAEKKSKEDLEKEISLQLTELSFLQLKNLCRHLILGD